MSQISEHLLKISPECFQHRIFRGISHSGSFFWSALPKNGKFCSASAKSIERRQSPSLFPSISLFPCQSTEARSWEAFSYPPQPKTLERQEQELNTDQTLSLIWRTCYTGALQEKPCCVLSLHNMMALKHTQDMWGMWNAQSLKRTSRH